MSDSDGDDWSFKVDKQKQSKKNENVRAKSPKGLLNKSKKKKDPSLKLDYTGAPKRVSRTKMAENESGEIQEARPSPMTRVMAGLVDSVVIFLLYKLSGFLNIFLKDQVKEIFILLKQEKLVKLSSFVEISNLLIFFVAYCIVFVILPAFWKKSIGKAFFKLVINNTFGEQVGPMRIVVREIIFKPLSSLSIFGILMIPFNNNRRGAHDYLSGTIVDFKHSVDN